MPKARLPRPSDSHKAIASKEVACVIVTVSDSKTLATDLTGKILENGLRKAGHAVLTRVVAKDEVAAIRRAVRRALKDRRVEAVITNGGTGITSRDVTPEALAPILTKKLEGFGELFRFLSYAQVGSAAIMSRAFAGCAGRKIVVALPGSPRAAELALKKLLIPELPHLVQQVSR